MASFPPKKNTAFSIYLPIVDADGDLVTAAATLSGTRSIDGGVFAATATPVEEGEGFYSIALTAGDMNGDAIAGVLKTTTAGAKNTPFVIYTVTRQVDDLAFPVVSGRGVDVDATGGVEITANQSVNVAQWLGVAVNALIAGRVDANTQALAAAVIAAGSFAADAIDSNALALSAANEIADALLKRDMSAVTGEAARSFLNAIRKLMNKWSISGSTLTVFKEDDLTAAYTQTITATAGADPITALDTV